MVKILFRSKEGEVCMSDGIEGEGHHPPLVPPFVPTDNYTRWLPVIRCFYCTALWCNLRSTLALTCKSPTRIDLPGQVICLPPVPPPSPACPTGLTYWRPRDTLFSIAQRLGLLSRRLALNPQIPTPTGSKPGNACVPLPMVQPCPPPPPALVHREEEWFHPAPESL